MPIGHLPPQGAGRKRHRTELETEEHPASKQFRITPEAFQGAGPQGVPLHKRRVKRRQGIRHKDSGVRVHERFLNDASQEELYDRLFEKIHNSKWLETKGKQTLSELLPADLNEKISRIQQLQREVLSGSQEDNEVQGSAIIQLLNELEADIKEKFQVIRGKSASSYIEAFWCWWHGDAANAEKIMKNLVYWVQSEARLVNQVVSDPGALGCAGKLSWNDAMEFKRLGYVLDPAFTVCSAFTDNDIADRADAVTVAGKGVRNTVYKIIYNKGGQAVTKIFKPVEAKDVSRWQSIIRKENYFDPNSPHFIARNMAAHKIACSLGMPHMVPKAEFAIHNGQMGMLMSQAPGKTSRHRFHPSGSLRDVLHGYGDKTRHTKILSGLNKTEWFDALCAQPDRHMDNSMVSKKSGQVSAIDNDFCLYPLNLIIEDSASWVDGDHMQKAGCRVGFPVLVGRDTLEAFRKLDIKGLKGELGHILSDGELNALEVRYRLLLEHAEGLEKLGMVVDDWATWCQPGGNLAPVAFLEYVDSNRRKLKENFRSMARDIAGGRDNPDLEFLKSLPEEKCLIWKTCRNLEETFTKGAVTSYFADGRRHLWKYENEQFSDDDGED